MAGAIAEPPGQGVFIAVLHACLNALGPNPALGDTSRILTVETVEQAKRQIDDPGYLDLFNYIGDHVPRMPGCAVVAAANVRRQMRTQRMMRL